MIDDPLSDRKEVMVCGCSGTTIGQIERYVGRGVDDLASISLASGACSGCGGCEADLLALLEEVRSRDLATAAPS